MIIKSDKSKLIYEHRMQHKMGFQCMLTELDGDLSTIIALNKLGYIFEHNLQTSGY